MLLAAAFAGVTTQGRALDVLWGPPSRYRSQFHAAAGYIFRLQKRFRGLSYVKGFVRMGASAGVVPAGDALAQARSVP
jgi:hypothetical protein